MPTFGKHESAQRLFLSGVGAIYALKSDEKKVIKVLQPPVGIWSNDRIQEEVDAFRLRAKTQRDLAKTSKNWAPIHEVGALREAPADAAAARSEETSAHEAMLHSRVANGAYSILNRYERSVQSLLDGRVNLLNADLRNLISGIMKGLLDIRNAPGGGRPHGALKPNNILLTDSADLASATVHLTDPAPDGALTPNAAEKDINDLGLILYELVNRRPYDGGVVPRTKEWNKIGPNGEDWRKLCNALLDAHAPAEQRDLEKILPVIQTWTAKPKQSKAPILAVAAAVLLIVGSITAYFVFRTPPIKYDQSKWETLSLSYQLWFGDFVEQMYTPAVRDKFRKPPYPTEVAKLFDDAGKDLDQYDPQKIAGLDGLTWQDHTINPPDRIKTGTGPKFTQQGVDLIQAVDEALTPAKWTVLNRLEATAKRYDELGWQKPAGGIRAVIAAAKTPALPNPSANIRERIKLVEDARKARTETIFESVERTIAAAKSVNDIDARWADIQEQLKTFRSGDATAIPLLKAFPEFAENIPHSESKPDDPGTLDDVTALAAAFTKIQAALTKLNAALTIKDRQIVYAELAKDPKAAPDIVPSIEAYEALGEVVPLYLKMEDDPRANLAINWGRVLPDVETNMTKFLTPAAEQGAPGAADHLKQLSERRTTLEQAIKTGAAIPSIEKNRDAITKGAMAVATSIQEIGADADEWSAPFKIDPDKFLADHRDYIAKSPLAKATPVVYEQWKAAQNKYIDSLVPVKQRLKDEYKFGQAVSKNFERLEAIYAAIEAAIPNPVPGLSTVAGADWRHTIAAYVASTYRETALKDLMLHLPAPSQDITNDADAAFISYKTQRLASFEKSRTDTLSLIADYTVILDRLDHLDLQLNEPSQGISFWRDLWAKWGGASTKNALLSDPVIIDAVKAITDRVSSLLALDSVADYKTLLTGTQSSAPEISLTAWRKLGDVPVTEDIPALDDEAKAEAALTTHVKALASANVLDAPRVQRISAEIDKARPERWHHWADLVKTAPNIEKALDATSSFNVTLNSQADAAMIFNRTFYDLRKEQAKGHTEAELKPIAQKFVDDVTKMPASVTGNPEIKGLLERMTKSLSTKQEESSANGAGPKLAKWEQDASRDGFRTFYYPSKDNAKFTLEFARMQVTENNSQKTIYLCTTEMSVGLFIEMMNTLGKIDDVDNDKHADAPHWFKVPAAKKDDVFLGTGVRSWAIVDRKFTLNENWLDDAGPQMIGKPYYPGTAIPAQPATDQPLQVITPWSAMYIARLLGCRLPTSDEWKVAYDTYETPAALPKDIWNLRGEGPGGRPTWRTQQDYTKTQEVNGLPYPDQGIFAPSSMLFKQIFGKNASPWMADALAKVAPNRITSSPTPYGSNFLWFLPVDKDTAGAPAAGGRPVMHHLVGNVGEFVFDADNAANVVPNNTPSVTEIDNAIKANATKLFVIGGSSLSPPEIPFNEKQPVALSLPGTKSGFADVGMRLAYTAPIDSIVDVLANAFKDPKYLPGPKAKL